MAGNVSEAEKNLSLGKWMFGLYKASTVWSILTGIYVFIWFTQIGDRISFFKEVRFEFILGSILILGSIYTRLTAKRSNSIPPSGVTFILFFLLGYFGIFALFSFNPAWSKMIYFDFMVKYAFMTLFIATFIDTKEKMTVLLLFYFLAIGKLAQEGFHGWVTGNLVWENQGIPRLHGSVDRYGHPNSFSGFGVTLLPFVYFFYPIANRVGKLLLLLLGFCAVVIIVFTGSRTGYVASLLLIGLAVYKHLKGNFIRGVLLAITVAFAIVQYLPEEYKGRFATLLNMQDQEGGSIGARRQIIVDAVAVFKEYPFGVGVGAFPTVRNYMFGRSQDTHNLYLEIVTNTGFIGLILFFIFISKLYLLYKRIISRIDTVLERDPSGAKELKLIRAVASAAIAYLLARLFLGMFGMDMYEIYWWFVTGLLLACHKITFRFRIAEKI